jgi:hypothetical protein
VNINTDTARRAADLLDQFNNVAANEEQIAVD